MFGRTGMSEGGGMTGGSTVGASTGVGGGIDVGGIGAIASAAAGIVNAGLSYDASMKNLEQQKKQLEYQKELQNILMGREDSAIQRRVIDYKAAGLSPVLAAGGSGAGAGPVVSTVTPQQQPFQLPTDTAALVLGAMKMEADISATRAQKRLIEMQTAKANSEKNLTDVTTASKYIDLTIQKATGMRSHPSEMGGLFSDLIGATQGKIANKIVDTLKSNKKDNTVESGMEINPIKRWFDLK